MNGQLEPSLKCHKLKDELEFALHLAYEAGEIARTIRAEGYEIWNKGGDVNNPVTEADKAASDHILLQLSSAFPHDVVISEEAKVPQTALNGKRIWFVDPIDGTKEFIKGINEWSVMIGLSIDGRSSLGVVYQPDKAITYYAVDEGGAYLSSDDHLQTMHVRTLKEMSHAILIQSRSHWSAKAKQVANQFGISQFLQHGSIGLKLGLISQGEADLYLNFSGHCHLWDLCAPAVILSEAGGALISVEGEPFNFHTNETLIKQSFVAGNKYSVAKISRFLQQVG